MSLKNKWKRLIATTLAVALILSGSEAGSLSYAAVADQKSISTTYLNETIKYLYVGDEKEGSFDFDIQKAVRQSDATYQWYINTKKGDPKAVSINKKTGLVTAKKAGKAYIGCKITFSTGKSIKPEAKVIVKANPTVADAEGSVTIKTQEQLDQVLSEKEVTSINLVTKSAQIFTIKEGDYSSKTLVVDAPNADVHNYGAFKNITVKAIKNSTWIEYSNGNRIYLSDSQLRIVIDNAAEVKEIVFDTPGVQADIVVNGKIENIKVLQQVDLNITGSAENTNLEVEESAKGSSLTTSVPIDVNISSEVNVVLHEGAEGTLLNRTNSDINVGVDNMTQQDIKLMTNEQGGETIAAGTSTIEEPSPTPTTKPTATPTPTTKPTVTPKPTTKPTATPKPTTKPTVTPKPTTKPTVSPKPTVTPAITPTAAPTAVPTPIVAPAYVPTQPSVPTVTPTPTVTPKGDNTAPNLTGVSLSIDKKTITLTFDEAIVNNCVDMAALKNQITFTTDNKTTANGLVLKDSISINDKKLIIVQDSPVYQEEVKLYIAAAALKDASGNIVNSILTANITGNDNTPQNASELTVDSDAVMKEINPSSDVDWFSFHAEAGQAYRITAGSLTNEETADPVEQKLSTSFSKDEFVTVVSLYSTDGITKLGEAYGHMIYKDSSAYVTSLDCAFVTAGIYYVKVVNQSEVYKSYNSIAAVNASNEAASTGGLYNIAISKTDGMASEPDNTPASASIIQAGTKKTGQWIMPASDVDYYKFDAKANETYYIRAYGEKEEIYVSSHLYDTDGVTVIKSAEDYELIEFTPSVSKTYYLSINAEVDPDYSNVGTYRLVLDSNESRATAAVIVAENALKVNPFSAREPFYNAQSLIAEIVDKNVADALSARLNVVKAGIDAALLATFNGSDDSTELLYLIADLQLTSFNDLSSAVQSDVIVLFKHDYPLVMGLRGFTSLDEVKEALNKTITKYNNWLSTVNSAADATAMKTALNSFAGIYNISVTDLYANVVFNERGSGYASITAIKAVKTTAVVTFNTVLYTPKTEYPYYDFSTGGGGVITATVDGVEIHSGDSIDKGKSVVFNYTPETGYTAFACYISGSGGPAKTSEYTVSNIANDVSLELRVKKTTSITIDAPTSYSRASTDDLIIKYTCQNTYFIGVYGPLVTTFPVELIKSGDATVVDGGVKISRKYLSDFLSQGSINFQVSFAMEYKDVNIIITD